MSNDDGLIDEYEKLENLKKEIEVKEEALKKRIIELAQERNTETLFGSHKKCSVKLYEKIVYPEDKTQIISLMKQKGIYSKFSNINYLKLNSEILKGNVENDIVDLIRKEKAFRIYFREL